MVAPGCLESHGKDPCRWLELAKLTDVWEVGRREEAWLEMTLEKPDVQYYKFSLSVEGKKSRVWKKRCQPLKNGLHTHSTPGSELCENGQGNAVLVQLPC